MTQIKNIIVGVDGSDSSQGALRWAYDEAAHHGASLTVVAAFNPPALPMTPPYGSMPPEGYESQPRRDALDLLDKLTSPLEAKSPPVDIRTSVEEANPAKVLIERSKEAELLVVGAIRHAIGGGLPSRGLGRDRVIVDTARRVL